MKSTMAGMKSTKAVIKSTESASPFSEIASMSTELPSGSTGTFHYNNVELFIFFFCEYSKCGLFWTRSILTR